MSDIDARKNLSLEEKDLFISEAKGFKADEIVVEQNLDNTFNVVAVYPDIVEDLDAKE